MVISVFSKYLNFNIAFNICSALSSASILGYLDKSLMENVRYFLYSSLTRFLDLIPLVSSALFTSFWVYRLFETELNIILRKIKPKKRCSYHFSVVRMLTVYPIRYPVSLCLIRSRYRVLIPSYSI
jgi:hypothetical protein